MFNQATIIGRLGRDPEMRKTQAGNSITTVSIATSETWMKNGERQERTEWHRVVIFAEKLAESVAKNAGKGDLLMVQGKLQTRKWTDKDGVERYSTEIVVDFGGTIRFLTPKKESSTSSTQDSMDTNQETGEIDDEIPF